MANLLLK